MEKEQYDRNAELLAFLHNNAEMGKDNLLQLNGIVKDEAIRQVIEHQIIEFKSVYDQTARRLDALCLEPRGELMAKMMSKVMISAKTMLDKSPDRVAEMVIQGSTMGVIDVVKKLKEYADCDDDIKNIGYKLLYIEQKNVDEMKHFL